MNEQMLNSLAELLNQILNDRPAKLEITIQHHVEIYLNIFLKTVEENNGEPVPYGSFSEQLWVKLVKDRPSYENTLNNFMNVWTAWVQLYRYLQERNIIQK